MWFRRIYSPENIRCRQKKRKKRERKGKREREVNYAAM